MHTITLLHVGPLRNGNNAVKGFRKSTEFTQKVGHIWGDGGLRVSNNAFINYNELREALSDSPPREVPGNTQERDKDQECGV